MASDPSSEPKIIVDEDWKSRVEREKEELQKQQQQAPDAKQQQQQQQQQQPLRLPPASFAGLVGSLVSQAAAALGDVLMPAEEGTNQEERLDPPVALELARHVIDILSILETKTQGNLTTDEATMLQQALHELRMAFIEAQKRH